jgi:UDP-N-acetylmuramate: L-alanyl-gamma-D-glutamyl-meso-diaminopimelate ligase
MHIHILGICGTFMGSLAVLAAQLGHKVTGSDANVYPPMSTQLEEQGITLQQGYDPSHLQPHPDLVIIGNAMSRGNPAVEYVLNRNIEYCSGPEWLRRHVLRDKWVLAVAGTHGKTTTSSMLAWILEYAGLKPGYLIGGVASNFPASADMGDSIFFVVEADEYDSAFFDKRSKFVHYLPRTVILNNLEFDHGDIFPDLAAIQRQFHHLVRTIPGEGLIISPSHDRHLQAVLAMGCWSQVQSFGVEQAASAQSAPWHNAGMSWRARLLSGDGSAFSLVRCAADAAEISADVSWSLTGVHNVSNALAAAAAAHHVGVELSTIAAALMRFRGVKRRMELIGEVRGIHIYDDFAHHPTAIEATLHGISSRLKNAGSAHRLIAVIEPRSNTMKMGLHNRELAASCAHADLALWMQSADALDLRQVVSECAAPAELFHSVEAIIAFLKTHARAGDHIVIMSNGGFGGIHRRLLQALGTS